ncbi:MFS transporter [Brevibacterium marinum]|uniref:Putative proline/betaine transporter n=2 Tax=Brevibacterium marinum TaxID=418643 RepID=A0A846RU12_9MICO|nr:MFS transporter [Brevibacterium marinum]NJC57279.1 MHS family proline/betaine transporter-like MFS transporter [Brevibacterium marinum]
MADEAAHDAQDHRVPTPDGIDINTMPPDEKRTLKRAIGGSALGNAVEWFDYGVYSYVSVYIASAFFPGEWGVALTFATLALSFVFRPLGGLILGPLGDKVGRQHVMVLTIIMMTIPTTIIGILPSYSTLGAFAPVLLLLCRMVQGFSTGGEYGGAAVYMAESAPDRRRGFCGSFLEMGTLAGTASAAFVCTIILVVVGSDGMEAGWWRLPFLLTLPLGAVALWLRMKLDEPEAFSQTTSKQQANRKPFRELFTGYKKQIVMLMAFVVLLNVGQYMVLTYMPTYLSSILGHSEVTSNFMLVGLLLAMIAVVSPLGRLTDSIGRKPVLYTSAIGFIVLSVPAFMLMHAEGRFLQFLGLGIIALLQVMMQSCVSATLPAIFPTQVRFSGFAIGYNISTAIFGGTTAAVNTFVIQATGFDLFPAVYLVGAGIIGLIGIHFFNETAGRPIDGDTPPGSEDEELAEMGYELIGFNDNNDDAEAQDTR